MASPQSGKITLDLRLAHLTIGNVTVPIRTGGGTALSLSPEQIHHLAEQIQRALMKQARRNRKRDEEQ